VLAVVLCLLDFFKFRSNLKIALILKAITLPLWSGNIYFMCCKMKIQLECNIIIGFIILEDLVASIFCVFTKRFKQIVDTVLLSISTAFLIAGVVLFFVDQNSELLSALAAGFWNTSVVI
ncbi:unnamed protein product, partial [Trichobilharzia szidati]